MTKSSYRINGEKVRELRIRRFMTQEQLAKAAGISPTQVSRLEGRKHVPHFSTTTRLAKALGVEPAELIIMEVPRTLSFAMA